MARTRRPPGWETPASSPGQAAQERHRRWVPEQNLGPRRELEYTCCWSGPCGPGGYGMKPDASSRVIRRTAACGSRADREYSDYAAVTGCIACPRRMWSGDLL